MSEKQRIATKKRTRQILEDYGFHTKKKFGQNFIVEPGVVEKIGAAVARRNPDTIIEIGPGIGALTEILCEKADDVEVFEIDSGCIPVLENEIGSDHLKIHQQDFLETDVNALLEGKKGRVAFASNLPYYITTPILFRLFEAEKPVDSITVMMQKEVADRFMARAGTSRYNALSVMSQYLCDMERIMDVNRNVFWPSPNVDSTVLQFVFHDERALEAAEEQEFFAMVKAAFTQRRKTLWNNLLEWNDDRKKLEALFERSGIAPSTRAQQLELDDFLHLFRTWKQISKENGEKED